MKLISCYVSGFGKIHDERFDFNDGLNVFCEDNGFGKSTLASFIKVMLYGFEDENKKSLKDKEREKFRPWNNGIYGGSITFEYEGKEYTLSGLAIMLTGKDVISGPEHLTFEGEKLSILRDRLENGDEDEPEDVDDVEEQDENEVLTDTEDDLFNTLFG